MFFCFDKLTRKRSSLHTNDRDAAEQIVLARNQALRQPVLNLQIAKAYLSGTDSGVATRTWQQALNALVETKHGSTKDRWIRAAKDKAFGEIRHQTIIETQAENLLQALKAGTVSTNVHLRKLHNFCLAMNWLPWPIRVHAKIATSTIHLLISIKENERLAPGVFPFPMTNDGIGSFCEPAGVVS